MGGKKKKYNARFPPARIKKIMQTDEEVGKIAAAVPVVISRALELFLESLITESVNIANTSNAKTLSSSHIKSVIQSKPSFDFLKTQVTLVPDLNADGAETLSAYVLEKKNSIMRTLSGASTSQCNADNAQVNSAMAGKRRPRPSSTGTSEEADKGDPNKPKKRRGRPPKVKPVEKSEEVKMEVTTPAPPISTTVPGIPAATGVPTTAPTDQPTTNGEVKKDEVKAEPTNSLSTTAATPTVTVPAAAQAQPPELDNDMHTESIFHTNTTVGLPATARSGLQQQAHTGSNINRYYETSQALNLSYPKSSMTDSRVRHANLSPTSQPMDLSYHRHMTSMSLTPMVVKDVETD